MSDDGKTLDLLAIGRSSVDLYGEQVGGRLEDMASFAKYVGGSPTNTAIGAARLGLKAALLTRVGGDHMGRFIREQLVREGVDVASVISDPDRLTALVILGIRDRESFPLIFYRENCADMALTAADVDEAQVRAARAVLINGTHLSQPAVREASMKAADLARASGGKVVFDVDYRPVLWGLAARDMGEDRFVAHEAVTAILQRVLPVCDLVVGTEEEIHILGGSTDTIEALRAVRKLTAALIVCKRGPKGCSAFPSAIGLETLDEGVVGAGFNVEVFNVLGAGDAFMPAASCAGGCGTRRSSSAANWPMRPAPSWSRGMAARRPCRPGLKCRPFWPTATARSACARTPSWNISTGPPPGPGATNS